MTNYLEFEKPLAEIEGKAEELRAMAQYIKDLDPYDHHIVVHTYPDWQDRVYPPLLGDRTARPVRP